MSSEHDSWENHSESMISGSESIYTISKPAEKEMIHDQLIVLEPNNPVMFKIQNTLKEQLLKQKEIIQQELLSLVSVLRFYILLKNCRHECEILLSIMLIKNVKQDGF